MNINKDTISKILTLYGASFIGIGLGFAISVFNTSILGKEAFGDFKFLETVFRFLASLVTIGVFISVTRMLAIAKEKILINLSFALFLNIKNTNGVIQTKLVA